MEKILKEKLLEECKLRALQKEAETYQPTEDEVSTLYGHLRRCSIVLYPSAKLCDFASQTNVRASNLIKVSIFTCCDKI